MNISQNCPPHQSDVATTLRREIKKVILTVLFIHTSDHLRYSKNKKVEGFFWNKVYTGHVHPHRPCKNWKSITLYK